MIISIVSNIKTLFYSKGRNNHWHAAAIEHSFSARGTINAIKAKLFPYKRAKDQAG
jgi:hypothetical protein